MNTDVSTPPGWDQGRFSEGVVELGRRVDALGERDPVDDGGDALAAELGTAYEELRVADEEIRVQTEVIDGLVAASEQLARQHERLTALVPVPVLATDRFGVVRSANAATAALLGVQLPRLVGKPLAAFVAAPDRPLLRRLLASPGSDGVDGRASLSLAGRGGRPVSVEAVASCLPSQGDEVTWLLLPPTVGTERDVAERLPAALLALSRLVARAQGPHELLAGAAQGIADLFGGAGDVSLCLGPPGEPTVVATSSGRAQSLDGSQAMSGHGPAVEAYGSGAVVVTTDVAEDDRWPGLGARLGEQRPVAAVAAPLVIGEAVAGVATVYLDPALDVEQCREVQVLLAAAVSSALQEAAVREDLRTLATQMRTALESRAVIEQAKGIVMGDRRCGPEAAFEHLVSLSSSRHVKLRVLAEEIVARAAGG